jgi:hypothetical protein
MAEMLHYTQGSARRAPGSLPVALSALQGLCMVLIKPVNDLSLVTMDGDGADNYHFFDQLQRVPAVRSALQACRYTDITQAIYSPVDYSASRGFGLGLVSNPGIDGIEIGSARSFETISSDSSMSVFKSGTNVLLFGRANEVLSHRLRIVQVTLLDMTPTGGWLVVMMRPNALGQFEVVSKTPL